METGLQTGHSITTIVINIKASVNIERLDNGHEIKVSYTTPSGPTPDPVVTTTYT